MAATIPTSAGPMLQNHTLVSHTIAHNAEAHPIFDANELALLRRFCENPASKEQILKDADMADLPGDKLGAGAAKKGSLAGTLVSRAGTEEDFLKIEEWASLKEWFAGKKG